jgi:hypothetical protein
MARAAVVRQNPKKTAINLKANFLIISLSPCIIFCFNLIIELRVRQ